MTQNARVHAFGEYTFHEDVRERHALDRGGFNLLDDSVFHALKVYFLIRTVGVVGKTFRAILLHQSYKVSLCTIILLEKSKRDEKARTRARRENPNPKNRERTTPPRG
mgnify:CR=1 FL=1